MTGWFWVGLLTGLASNECCSISEWTARRLVRWSAHVRYEEPERAEIRAQELEAVVADRPCQLFKLITAACFVLAAVRAWIGRATAGAPVTSVIPSGVAVLRITATASARIIAVTVPFAIALSSLFVVSGIQVQSSAAHSFLESYYEKVVQPSARSYLFQNDLTANFRSLPSASWSSYENFWATQRSVTVNSVIPVSGNRMEFTVNLTYESKGTNKAIAITSDVWLICHGNFLTGLTGRLPGMGCPADNLQIDATKVIQAETNK